jgi:hypothetical protein
LSWKAVPAEPEDKVIAMLAGKGLALLKEARNKTAAGSINFGGKL